MPTPTPTNSCANTYPPGIKLRLSHTQRHKHTWGVGAAPASHESQGVSTPRGRGLGVGQARRWPCGSSCVPESLWDFPKLVRERRLGVWDGPWGPSGLHVRQLACRSEVWMCEEVRRENRVCWQTSYFLFLILCTPHILWWNVFSQQS